MLISLIPWIKASKCYNDCENFVVLIISASSLYFQSYQPIIPSGTLSLELSYISGGTLINLRLLGYTWICQYLCQRQVTVIYSWSHFQLFCDPLDCSLPSSSVRGIFQVLIFLSVLIYILPGKQCKFSKRLFLQDTTLGTEESFEVIYILGLNSKYFAIWAQLSIHVVKEAAFLVSEHLEKSFQPQVENFWATLV